MGSFEKPSDIDPFQPYPLEVEPSPFGKYFKRGLLLIILCGLGLSAYAFFTQPTAEERLTMVAVECGYSKTEEKGISVPLSTFPRSTVDDWREHIASMSREDFRADPQTICLKFSQNGQTIHWLSTTWSNGSEVGMLWHQDKKSTDAIVAEAILQMSRNPNP